ncbi:MAG: hypothetical protein A2X61_05580 [Ignavibacteria bacterium GWB2_35_12]|nr:MAG: hypothetical protein A2X61_05580 [Ignavibacteria bacterium GWB2_35_12]OGV19975.1 MAG: hypothetical protein A2475_00170 [Ignavibacteria bacterium RIFOXYC2_FULL_35_21]
MDVALIINNTYILVNLLPDVKSALKNKYSFLPDDEIVVACNIIFWNILRHDIYLKCKDDSDLYRLLYKSCNNKIKNIIKRNKKLVSLEETAADAGMKPLEFIDMKMCNNQIDDIEKNLDLELLKKAMPSEFFTLLLMHYSNHKLENIAEHFHVSRITIIRRLVKAKEMAIALLTGNPPPPKKERKKKIKIN